MDQALGLMEQAADGREGAMTYLTVWPIYDPIRNEPRFKEIVRRVGLV